MTSQPTRVKVSASALSAAHQRSKERLEAARAAQDLAAQDLELREERLALEKKELALHERQLVAEKSKHAVLEQRLKAEEQRAATQVDEDLAFALALSFLDDASAARLVADTQAALELRKAAEEAATAAVLGDVQQFKVDAALSADGAVTIGARRYARVERGASHDIHQNLCGYLSLTAGDGPAAVQLKLALAPAATRFSASVGAHVDFAGLATLADTEVIRAYVVRERTPVCVYNADAAVATTYRADGCAHDCKYLYLGAGHFQQLLPL